MKEIEEVKKVLGKLLELEISSKPELKAWNEHASIIYEIEQAAKFELPEIVWHYLSDADIRFKDPKYGEHQVVGVKAFINDI